MKFKFWVLIFSCFIMQSLMANDKEIKIIRHNKLEYLTNQMETCFENENTDSTSFYIREIESLSNLEEFKNYYLNSVALKAKVLFKKNRYLEADSIYQYVLSNAPEDSIKADVKKDLCIIYNTWGRYEESIAYIEGAMEDFNEEEKQAEKSIYFLYLGYVHISWGKSTKGLEYYLKAYQAALEYGNSENTTNVLYNIAAFYRNRGVQEMAVEYSQKALEHSSNLDIRWKILNNLITIYNKQGNLDSAAIYINKTLAIDTLESFSAPHNLFYYSRSCYHALRGSYDEAINFASKGLKIAQDKQNINYQIPMYECFAEIYYLQKKYEKTLSYIDTIETLGIYFLSPTFRGKRANIYMEQNKWEEAIKDLEYVRNQIYRRVGNNDLFKLNNKLIKEKNEFKKREVNFKIEETKRKLSTQRIITVILALLFFVALVITYFFIKLYKRKELYAQLAEVKNDELAGMSEFNHRLLHTLGRDLKSPVNSLEIIFNEILNKKISTKEFIENLPRLKKNITGTSLTLNNILQWGLIKNNEEKEQYLKEMDLHLEVETIKEIFSSSLEMKDIEFLNQIPENYSIIADNYKINLIFRNLISNAIKFTPEKGKIVFSAEGNFEETIIKIQDTGIGIRNDEIENVFENNMSIKKNNRRGEGFGIGLSLCNEMILQMNGKIWAETNQGKGSVFYIQIPN